MTLDEAIEHGKEQLEIFGGEHKEFIKTSMDAMRKYEEIEKIVEDRNGKPPLTTLNEIIMVVEEWTYYKKK